MKIPKLTDIIDSLTELEVLPSKRIKGCGLYCPEINEIKYNPNKIKTKTEFILTILHECIHHLDEDNELEELHTELLAKYLISNRSIKNYIQTLFNNEITRLKK